MYVLGLTGLIASGKSTVESFFKDCGATVLEADALVHTLQQAGTPQTQAVVNQLGKAILTPNGDLDRKALSLKIQEDPSLLPFLEEVFFPAVKDVMEVSLATYAAQTEPTISMVIISAPLLFQAGLEDLCDSVALCDCPEDISQERALARPGMTLARYDLYQGRQLTLLELQNRCQHHIPTLQKQETEQAVRSLYQALLTDTKS